MPDTTPLRVTVVYAEPTRVFRTAVTLPPGATVAAAIEASGFSRVHPEIEIRPDQIGIFARRARLTTALRDGDRVEIYRPLKVDPKEARRKRARRPGFQ